MISIKNKIVSLEKELLILKELDSKFPNMKFGTKFWDRNQPILASDFNDNFDKIEIRNCNDFIYLTFFYETDHIEFDKIYANPGAFLLGCYTYEAIGSKYIYYLRIDEYLDERLMLYKISEKMIKMACGRLIQDFDIIKNVKVFPILEQTYKKLVALK